MNVKYVAPYIPPIDEMQASFTCPYCDVYAAHQFHNLAYYKHSKGYADFKDHAMSICSYCTYVVVWNRGTQQIIEPSSSIAPMPSNDMPDDIKQDFEEARQIVGVSPRGAAALLRLCVQKLMIHLGEKGKDIDDDIASLVKKGLPVRIQQALDTVRVIGNESVHPGQMDLKDDRETALKLFSLINIIIQNRITEPKEIEDLYNMLPQTKRDGITKRDA
jgi:uncharacterized Zn-finger protein